MRIAVVRDNESEIAAEILRSVRPVFLFFWMYCTRVYSDSQVYLCCPNHDSFSLFAVATTIATTEQQSLEQLLPFSNNR